VAGAGRTVIDAGYFARRVKATPDHLPVPGVREICSVSECISPGADDWITSWRHNSLGWFNSVSDAVSVVPKERRGEYRLFAYRIHPELFRGRERRPLAVPDAVSVVPKERRGEYRLFAYRIHPELFRGRERRPLALPDDVRPDALPTGFRSIGFDSASRSSEAGPSLECSPLSCNGLATELLVNEHCLFQTLDDAIAGAARFANEQPEPGDYYVVEVLEGGLEG